MAYSFQVDTAGTLTTSLVSYYKLDSNSNDVWGGKNGTDTSMSYVSGKVNNAASFNGTSSRINVSAGMSSSPTYSVNFWIYTGTLKYDVIMGLNSVDGNANSNAIFWYYSAPTSVISIYDGVSGNAWKGSTALSTSTWYMITITINSGDADPNIYVNNSLQTLSKDGTPAGSNLKLNGDWVFGNRRDLYVDYYYNGYLDELGIWTKVLSSTERGDLYNSGSGQTMVDAVVKDIIQEGILAFAR
jgi:hypothetical protein